MLLLALAAVACGLGSGAGWAKHKSHSDAAVDPCKKLDGHMTKRLNKIRALLKQIEKEQTLPNTMEGVFDLMQGKHYVDHAKSEQISSLRKEADDLNGIMRGLGCPSVDIAQELRKPSTAPLRQ